MNQYPFSILDIAEILKLRVRRRQPTNMDVDCPFCGHKKGKMNINFSKNVFRCNYCNESGGIVGNDCLSICDVLYGIETSPR